MDEFQIIIIKTSVTEQEVNKKKYLQYVLQKINWINNGLP